MYTTKYLCIKSYNDLLMILQFTLQVEARLLKLNHFILGDFLFGLCKSFTFENLLFPSIFINFQASELLEKMRNSQLQMFWHHWSFVISPSATSNSSLVCGLSPLNGFLHPPRLSYFTSVVLLKSCFSLPCLKLYVNVQSILLWSSYKIQVVLAHSKISF